MVADGKRIQKDSIIIADYLENSGITDVYFVESEQDRYESAVYSYLKYPIKRISVDDIENIRHDGAIILASAESEIDNLQRFEPVDIGTEILKMSHLKSDLLQPSG